MATKEPTAEALPSAVENTTPIPLADVLGRIEGDRMTHWLTTVRPDGRPHVVPVGAVWHEGALYFTTGQNTRKEQNIAHNAHCAIAFDVPGFDVVVEGHAAKVTDAATLQQVAEVYNADGWPATVGEGAFDAPFSAPTTGPAPYTVYEITPTTGFAFGNIKETVSRCTRYRF